MSNAVIILGLVVVLAVQIATHIRVARIPARAAARVKAEAEASVRAQMSAIEDATRSRVEVLVTELRRFHDALAEEYRAQVGTAQSRARVAEARSTEGAKVMTGLRAHANEVAALVGELHTIAGDLAELIFTVTQRLVPRSPAPGEQTSGATSNDDGGDRMKVDTVGEGQGVERRGALPPAPGAQVEGQ